MEMVQVNFRCPEDIRPVLLRIGARLRDEPGFAAVLARWFAGVEAGAALSENPVLSGRLTEIERRLFALERQAPAVPVQAPAPAVVAPVVDDAPAVPVAPEPAAPDSPVARFLDMKRADPPWTVEGGKGRSLTPIGEQRFGEMVSAGLAMAKISDLTGLSPATVGRRKREIREAANA